MDGQQLTSDKRLQYLNNIIKGSINASKIEAAINDSDNNDNDPEDEKATSFVNDNDKENCDTTDWVEWANSLWSSAQKIAENSENGNIINACYNPEFAKQIKTQLLPYLPIWTGVMRPYFQRSEQIATSSSVEAEFGDLKNRCFKGQLPTRIDKFVIQHMNFLDAKIILASDETDISSKQHKLLQEKKHTEEKMPDKIIDNITEETNEIEMIPEETYKIEKTPDNDITNITKETHEIDIKEERAEESWNTIENWHGLMGSKEIYNDSPQEIPVPKKRKRPSYLDKCAEWDYIKNIKSHNLPLFINGNKCKAVSVKRGSLMTVQQTCAFDSIVQLVANAIAAHRAYRDAVQSSADSIFHLAKSILEYGKLVTTHYVERAKILQAVPIFQDAMTVYTRNIMRLNANCNVAHLAEYIFPNEPTCNFTKTCTCGVTISRESVICSVNVDILLQEGLQHMQRAIEDTNNISSNCRKCGAPAKSKINFGNHILIDTSVFTDDTYIHRQTKIQHNLNTTAKIITLNDADYVLAGLVQYVKYKNSNNGHYIAFAFAGTHWYKYDDLGKKRETANPTQKIDPHLIFYVKR